MDNTKPGPENPSSNSTSGNSPIVHFLSTNSEWSTPRAFFDSLDTEFRFTLDACATDANAKCANYFSAEQDGLKQDWGRNIVFMNPPYGRQISDWMQKAYLSSIDGATVVCLVPARTDTRWWHDFAVKGEIRFLKGRIRFEGSPHSAPFPSALVIFRAASKTE
jgi:phage N-6-adenine-methyltransferase